MSVTPRFQPPSPEANSASPRLATVGRYTVTSPKPSTVIQRSAAGSRTGDDLCDFGGEALLADACAAGLPETGFAATAWAAGTTSQASAHAIAGKRTRIKGNSGKG